MTRFDYIRYFMGIVPGSKNEYAETVAVATLLTFLVSVSMVGAFCRFAAVYGTLGFQGAFVDAAIRFIAAIAFISMCVILYQYLSNGIFFLACWVICFPIEFLIMKLQRSSGRLSVSRVASPLNGSQTNPIMLSIPILLPKDVSTVADEQEEEKMAVLLLPLPDNNMFLSMLTDKCSDKNGLYNAFVSENDSIIKDSLDFAIKYWALVKLELICDNMQDYLRSVPSRYCPVKRGQLSNLVRKVRKSIKEYLKAEKEGYEATEEELEIYERYMVLKNRFKQFKCN